MTPASFPESNHVLDKPDDMDREACEALSVWTGEYEDGVPVVISCWKLTPEELKEIQKTGRVWLHVFGITMPPVFLGGVCPFKRLSDGGQT